MNQQKEAQVIEAAPGSFSRREERETALAVIPPEQATPMSMLAIAVQKGMDPATLKDLMDLQERWDKAEAKKAFVAALAEFKANPPELHKNKQVRFETAKGVTAYKHATLDEVSIAIGKSLSEHGLSHHWNVEQKEGGMIRVTCILTHSRGHSESVSLEAGRDDSGTKNNIQALGSTVTYLQRYTLLAATGMAVKDQDDDGRTSDKKEEDVISPKQVSDWDAEIAACDSLDELSKIGKKITAACEKIKDLDTYNIFKVVVSERRAALKAKK